MLDIQSRFILLFFLTLSCSGAEFALPRETVLYTKFTVEPPQAIMESMRDELAAIMSPMGFHIIWQSLSAARDYPEAERVAVITFKGRCDFSGSSPVIRNGEVLGMTHISDGAILPFSEVDCDAIRAFIQEQLWKRYSDAMPKIFGSAVARVLAHELYHVFARTSKHRSSGLGKSAYTAAELLSNEFHFEKRDVIALRDSENMEARKNAKRIPKTRGVPGNDFN